MGLPVPAGASSIDSRTNTSGVMVTLPMVRTVPLAAVMIAVPATVEVIVEVAMPPVVGRVGGSALPRLDVNVTTVPFATELP